MNFIELIWWILSNVTLNLCDILNLILVSDFFFNFFQIQFKIFCSAVLSLCFWRRLVCPFLISCCLILSFLFHGPWLDTHIRSCHSHLCFLTSLSYLPSPCLSRHIQYNSNRFTNFCSSVCSPVFSPPIFNFIDFIILKSLLGFSSNLLGCF